MHATARQYTGMPLHTVDELLQRQAEIETLIREIPGFVHYNLLQTAGGMTSVVCQDHTGTEASTRQVAAWIQTNLPTLLPTPPMVTAGESVLHFSA